VSPKDRSFFKGSSGRSLYTPIHPQNTPIHPEKTPIHPDIPPRSANEGKRSQTIANDRKRSQIISRIIHGSRAFEAVNNARKINGTDSAVPEQSSCEYKLARASQSSRHMSPNSRTTESKCANYVTICLRLPAATSVYIYTRTHVHAYTHTQAHIYLLLSLSLSSLRHFFPLASISRYYSFLAPLCLPWTRCPPLPPTRDVITKLLPHYRGRSKAPLASGANPTFLSSAHDRGLD
jgi:hypothetical protein